MYTHDHKQGTDNSAPAAQRADGERSDAAKIQDNRVKTIAQRQLQEGIQKYPQGNRSKALQQITLNQSPNQSLPQLELIVDPGDTEAESPRLKTIKELSGDTPTHDSIFDGFVKTLKADGFKYTSSSSGGTDILGGSNEGACASIRIGLSKAFKSILGADQARGNQMIKDIYVPIDADYIDSSCNGNVENDRAYFFVQHYYLEGFDPTSGKKGSLNYNVGSKTSLYDWVKGFDISVQTENKDRFQELTTKVEAVRKFDSFYLLTIDRKYYKVGNSSEDIKFLSLHDI